MDAARHLFAMRGYENTSIAQIVSRSGGSLATFYKFFGGKDGVLIALCEDDPDNGPARHAQLCAEIADPRTLLTTLGEALVRKLTDPQLIPIAQVMIGRSLCDARFGSMIEERFGLYLATTLSRRFRDWMDEGVIREDDPTELADMYLAILLYQPHLRAIHHSNRPPPTPEVVRQRIERFLRLIGLDAQDAAPTPAP